MGVSHLWMFISKQIMQSHRTKVERVGARYSCLHAVARFHHFHPSTSYQGILVSGG